MPEKLDADEKISDQNKLWKIKVMKNKAKGHDLGIYVLNLEALNG